MTRDFATAGDGNRGRRWAPSRLTRYYRDSGHTQNAKPRGILAQSVTDRSPLVVHWKDHKPPTNGIDGIGGIDTSTYLPPDSAAAFTNRFEDRLKCYEIISR